MAEAKFRLQEALQSVNELETAYQNTATDLDKKATVVKPICPDSPLADTPHLVSNDAIYALRNAWDWTSKLHYCLEIHRSNAERYNLFYYEAHRVEQVLSQILSWVTAQRQKTCRDSPTLVRHLRVICEQLLGCQAVVDRLHRSASSTAPVHLRTSKLTHPVKVQALVNYVSDDGAIKENQTYLLTDNSDPHEWKLKTFDDRPIKAPGITLSIPPPCSDAVLKGQRLRLQLLSAWKIAYHSLQRLVRNSHHEYLNQARPADAEYMNASQRTDVMKALGKMGSLLKPETGEDSDIFRDFLEESQKWEVTLEAITETQPDRRGIGKAMHSEWKGHLKTLKTLEDFAVFADAYKKQVESTRTDFQKVVNSTQARFVSRAYIERINEPKEEQRKTAEAEDTELGDHMILEECFPLLKSKEEMELLEEGETITKTTTETTEDEFYSHSLRETKTFHIKAVIDPRTKEQISIYTAIAEGIISQTQGLYRNPTTGESMPIPEAMNNGLIIVEYVNRSVDMDKLIRQGILTTTSTTEKISYSIKYVKDPVSGEEISVKEALEKGIIDQARGRYVNPRTGDSISLMDAIKRGFMQGKVCHREDLPVVSQEIQNNSAMNGLDGLDRYVGMNGIERGAGENTQKEYIVTGVINPRTGRQMDLADAINNGLIDLEAGTYYDPVHGETMPLSTAVERGLIRVKLADPVNDEQSPYKVKLRVLTNGNPPQKHIGDEVDGSGDYIDAAEADEIDVYDEVGIIEEENLNHRVFEKLKGYMDTSVYGIKEEISGQEYTIEGAFENGVLKMDPLRLENANGEKYTLQEAAAMGLIAPNALREILKAVEENSIGHLVNSGQLDLEAAVYFDPNSNEALPIAQAIAEGKLDPDSIYYIDKTSNTIYPLSSAIENNKFDAETGMIIDPKTGKMVPLADAVAEGIIASDVDAEHLAQQATAMKLLKMHMDTNVKGVKDPETMEELTVEQAIQAGILDIPHVEYVNPMTGEAMTLSDAVEEKFIEPETAKKILASIAESDLEKAIANSLIDPKSGKVIHPDSKRKMTIEEAIEAGVFDPYSVFVVDPTSNEIVSLGALTEEGRFNPATGKFKDPLTNLEVGFSHAISKGIIKPRVQPDAFIAEKANLQDLLTSGRLNPQTATFITPDGKEISLKDALKEGYLNPSSVVKVDPKTGHVVLADKPDEEIVKSMLELKDKLAVVSAVEKALAQQLLPTDHPESVKDLLAFHQDLQKKLERHAGPVEDVLERSLAVLENNKNVGKEPTKQAQYQRLRFNTADLKGRFNTINSELEQRVERLREMSGNLDEYRENLDAFDDWANEAQGQMNVIKKAVADFDQIEQIAPELKEFTEEALSREDQLKAVARPASKFLTDAKEYEREADKFRQGLQEKYEKPEPQELHLADELKGAGETLKDIVGDCSSLMAKVTETATKNQRYNELKKQLSDWLPSMEERVNKCSAEVPAGDDPKKQVDELNRLTSDVIAEGQRVEDLKTIGKDLLAVLEELECQDSPKAREIQAVMDTVQTKFDEIQENVVDKQHRLNQAVVQSQDVYRHLDGLLDWVAQTEETLNSPSLISLDRAVLHEQIQSHMLLCSDIENHKAKLASLDEKCQGKEGTEMKLEELHERFALVEKSAKDRAVALDGTTQKLSSFHGGVGHMESWLANAVQSLKRESGDYDQGSIKDKIENLYRQKAGKQKDLNSLKQVGKELINSPQTGDKNKLRESLADVQGKWHDLSELLVQMISFAALREIDELLKYLDRAENEINTAEPISTDPETLAVQLRDHKQFHDDLESKRKAVNDTIDKCNKMLRETTNEEADDIKNKLDTIRNQADLVCKLSSERLGVLEEAVPLASHFSETHADLQAWLGEVEAEIESLEVPEEGNADQIKKQQENAKSTMRIIDDHKPLIEDLNNTGHELMDMCTDEDASDLKEDIDGVNNKYEEVKSAIRAKLQHLDEALRNVTSEVTDQVDSLLEELHYLNDQVDHAEPVACNPDTLREQIAENNTWLDDLARRLPAVQAVKDGAKRMLDQQAPDTEEEFEDLRSKLQELDNLQENIKAQASERSAKLDQALNVADQFHSGFHDITRALRDVQDNLASQDSPGIDPATIQEQQRELAAISEELATLQGPMEESKRMGQVLSELCGTPGKMELQKHMEDLDTMAEELEEGVKERQEELAHTLDKAEKFDATYQGVVQWLSKAEARLQNLGPLAADHRNIRIQIEELKVFKVQVHPQCVEIQNLNQYASELKTASPHTAESLGPQVKDVNDRWNNLLKGLSDREKGLKDGLVRLGELDHAMDDVIEVLQKTQHDLCELEDVYGDPKFIETHLKKLQLVQGDLKNQESSMKKLNKAVSDIVKNSGRPMSPLLEKQEEMNDLYKSVALMARDRQNQLHDTLREIKQFSGEVEDLLRWFAEFKQSLRSSAPLGALPDTAQRQFEKFMSQYKELQQKEGEVEALLLNGQDMLSRCQEGQANQLQSDLHKLQDRCSDAKIKADKKKHRLEEHLQNVKDFHAMLGIHTDWLNNSEKILGTFKHPSKLVERVLKQMQDHKEFRNDIEAHRDIMQNLDRTGTYLKYFGRKQDTVYIRNLLMNIKLRWKKLVRRTDEKGRILQQAHKEDKRFHDAWYDLCQWIDEHEQKMKKFASGAPAKVKQDIDDLKHFQHQLAQKHPTYYSTMRLGRALKDRCTKSDPEREVLQGMLDELKNKWNVIRTIASQRQNKLDEALLSSGRFSDAVQSLMEWLQKAEAYVAEDQPTLGDLDTVNILIEQHKQFQQELDSRAGVVQTLRATPNLDSSVVSQLEELSNAWDAVGHLSDVRGQRLQDALKLAEDFNEAVTVVREFLPHAEGELKFKQLPEDEDTIVKLIEQHEQFMDELKGHQPDVERIKYQADEILMSCHPNAIRFVKYYLTITQTRWEQLTNRANQRSQRLQEALRNIRGQAALTEELLAWLTEAQALLNAKEKDPVPDDLNVVETLVREHLEFHDELSTRNKDVERLTKLPPIKEHKPGRASETDSSMRVHTLQNKWRNVWRISVNRKKRLQDALDHLLELESFKNFDFDLWRQRYMNWIRAKKFRITDFFRRQDKDGDGYITRTEFVEGMLTSKFPTNRTELNAVFDIFDRTSSGQLDYREFVEALRPERRGPVKRHLTDSELISNEIEQQVSRCQCRQQFKASKIGEGKFKFGENQKLRLVRFLNSTVMVRVGGGWVTLAEFLEQNDPCRAKGRTNMELRDQYLDPDRVHQRSMSFTPRRGASASSAGTPTSNGTPRGRQDPNKSISSPAAQLIKSRKLSGSTSRLSASPAQLSPSVAGTKNSHLAKSWSNLSSRRGSTSNLAGSSKRSTHSSGSSDGSARTPKSPKSRRSTTAGLTPHSANGKAAPSGARTPTDQRTPTGPRSRSPATARKEKKSTSRGTPH